MLNRAYATLSIKSIDEEAWTFEGIASTPTADRGEDIVNPLGAVYKLPLPMLWQHGKGAIKDPVGWITAAAPNKTGIPVKGQMAKPKADYPQSLKDELTGAWVKVRDGLVRGLSIGFSPIEAEPIKGTFGMNFKKWEWLELSAVAIPMQAEATITSIKSFDQESLRAASGESREPVNRTTSPPGATGNKRTGIEPVFLRPEQGKTMKTIQEQIAGFEAKRAAAASRMTEIMNKSGEEAATLDDAQTEEYDGLAAEVKSVDAHLVRLRDHEKTMVATAVAVKPTINGEGANSTEGIGKQVRVEMGKSNLPKGTAFTRYALALAFSKGNIEQAAKMATRWKDTSPEVGNVLRFASEVGGTDFVAQKMHGNGILEKVAVAAGTTTDTTWASPLVQYNNMASEFVSLLYPKTILGQMNGLRRVPFNIRFPSQTAGATVGWVGQGAGKPVSKLAFATNTLGFAKAAGIVVITQELARFSDPAAEGLVRNDLVDTIAQFEDVQFISPGIVAVANVSPASITNGITNIVQSGGATRALIDADVATLMTAFLAANIPLTSLVWIMTPYNAMKLSMIRETNGEMSYPDITMNGGTWQGIPVITSNNVPSSTSAGSIIVLVAQNEVFLADDGGVQLDSSEQASLQMDTAPTNNGTGTPTATTLVSLWQDNLIGIRAEIIVNWQRRRDAGVGYIDNAHF